METFKGITAYEGVVAFYRSLRSIYNFINIFLKTAKIEMAVCVEHMLL
jgi:hypothetical protein